MTNSWSLTYETADDALRFTIATTGDETTYVGTTDVAADGQWHHLAFVVASRNATPGADDVEIYVDGVAEGTLAADAVGTNIDVSTDQPQMIGARDASSSRTDVLNGQLTDVCLYRRALSAGEVRQLAERQGVAYECRLHSPRFC